MSAVAESDDVRHRREEAERRAKRKASKSSNVASAKGRKRREHTQRVLEQQNKRVKTSLSAPGKHGVADSSAFQALFSQRAQGFQIDFSFRNAPPRPPVGPCFVGQGIDGQLQEMTLYRPLNAVEVNYQWKLHAENDLGVPLAPSAMNLAMYKKPDTTNPPPLHPDDAALLDWKGSMGDTAAEELQKSKDRARAAARLALAGKTIPTSPQTPQFQKKGSKKEFSRVLDDKMVFFMKKTTYLSNDYSRKVHDFTSLAEIKAREETQLKAKQQQFDRSAKAVEKTFSNFRLQHPKDKNLKPVWDYPLLPNVARWGDTFTHVVMDNPPKSMTRDVDALSQAFVAHVEQRSSSSRMTCQLLIPDHQLADQENDELRLKSIAQYDLDVVPLKESEDAAHTNFSLWIDPEDQIVYFLPIPSRVQLSSGRPGKRVSTVSRRPLKEDEDYLERVAQVDMDVAKQLDAKNKDEFGVYEDDDDEDEKKEAGGQRKTTEIMDFDDDDED